MKYIEYIKYLKKNNIKLFDSDYRISYCRFNSLNNNNILYGGGTNILYKLSKNKITKLIKLLLNNNNNLAMLN